MKKIIAILLFLFLLAKPAEAITDPTTTTNNRFGIHVLNLDDLEPASKLVNSNGGQWGYVTLVIRANDQNLDKWQQVFDKCRELKLIPIVRLATSPENDYWVKPNSDDIKSWVSFLDSLNWVIQNRYVILFNEPNHAKEWGNDINPQEYTKISKKFIKALKESSSDYFILPAGLDTAAPNSSSTMAAIDYWQQMLKADSSIFTLFDGWNSHSYPNPGFSGSVNGTGFGSLTSYQSELKLLSSFGLPPDIPVFITETGWIHQEGKVLGASTNPSTALSDFYTSAFRNIWTEPNLIAITPFVLNYPQAPFEQFAWQIPNTNQFFPHYYAVQDLGKLSGQPIQIHNSIITHTNIPDQLIDSSTYQFQITFKNTGQSIWDHQDFYLKPSGDFPSDFITVSNPKESDSVTKPDSTLTFLINLKTPETDGLMDLGLQLQTNLTPFGEEFSKSIKIIAPPNLIIKAKRLLARNKPTTDYQLLIYNQNQDLKEELSITLTNQASNPIKLYNLIPNAVYRFVLLKPRYLPRQVITTLNQTTTNIKFKTLLPLDFNQDGQFTFKDFLPWLK